MQVTPNLLSGSLLALMEFLQLIRGQHQHAEIDQHGLSASVAANREISQTHSLAERDDRAEVSIRIVEGGDSGDQFRLTSRNVVSVLRDTTDGGAQASSSNMQNLIRSTGVESGHAASHGSHVINIGNHEDSAVVGTSSGNRGTVSQQYDFQQLARWIEQVLPFTILLLMVFIRQHVQGFFITFWVSAVMVKANDLLRKQTALKGERKMAVLMLVSVVLLTHILIVYFLYRGEDLLRPLFMVPPKEIPKFWQAIFIIIVNDTMVRQVAMVTKCLVLIHYKHSRGRPYHQQAQLLTAIEYILLLYRALLPAPVWYRFFLNKEYGSLFSSLTTGLYLTFKLTATLEKVQRFFVAIKLLFRREVQYGSSATCEEVLAAGDLCAICQEKMHAPISLTCKHIFCEDCVSEWFERERTCPLCRAVVKSAGLRSFGDGSTCLFFQIF